MLTDYIVKVFNRSGGQVAEFDNLDFSWDGGRLPDGVYWWIVQPTGASNASEEPLRGALKIIRDPNPTFRN